MLRTLIFKYAHRLTKTGIPFAQALSLAWSYAKNNWRFVTFTKANGQQVTRLVYTTNHNSKAIRGGQRTIGMEYTLHVEVQNGVPLPTDDFNPLTAKWLSCKEPQYRKITKTA